MIQISVSVNMDICRGLPSLIQIPHSKVLKKVMTSMRKRKIMDALRASQTKSSLFENAESTWQAIYSSLIAWASVTLVAKVTLPLRLDNEPSSFQKPSQVRASIHLNQIFPKGQLEGYKSKVDRESRWDLVHRPIWS